MNSKIVVKFKWIVGSLFDLLLKLSPIIIVIFIAVGDKFLPRPLSDYSLQTRTSINKFLEGLFPEDIDSPYDNTRNEKVIEEMEKGRGNNKSP